ncbi:MAG: GIY-YIG nuclease family protein [Elainellaceae cyanobacterium]
MARRYGNVIYIDRDPHDPYKGWGWVEVTTEDIKRYGIPKADPETYRKGYIPRDRRSGNLPSRGRAGTKKFTVNMDGDLITISAQKSLTIQAVCAWVRSWATPTSTIITPGNRTLSLDGEVKNRATHFVYFILNEDCQAIKIGRAKDLNKRIQALQTASPVFLKLLKSVQLSSEKESHELEQSLHKRFSDFRMQGEWFRSEAELLEYVTQSQGLNDYR